MAEDLLCVLTLMITFKRIRLPSKLVKKSIRKLRKALATLNIVSYKHHNQL